MWALPTPARGYAPLPPSLLTATSTCAKNTPVKDTFLQTLRLGFAIVALAFLLYWVDAAFFAPGRLPACRQEQLPEGRVCLDTLQAQGLDKVVWIDARSESDYEINHLMLSDNRSFPIRTGARFDSLLDAAIDRLVSAGERGETVVVFCTRDCESAETIAARLRELELIEAPILVLEGGWDALKDFGLERVR